MDLLHIGYHGQVLWAADACKLELGFVPNLSNYGYIFLYILIVCCDISEMNLVILFIFDVVIRFYALLMHIKLHLAMCHN